jgi:hypothetical protein
MIHLYIPLFDKQVLLDYVADRRVLTHLLGTVVEIREVDHIVLLGDKDDEALWLEQAAAYSDNRIRFQALAEPIYPLVRLARLVGMSADDGDLLVAVSPYFPFLDGGIIEQAIAQVLSKKVEAAATVCGAWSTIYNGAGTHKVTHKPHFVDACVVVTRKDIEVGDANVLGQSLAPLPLTAIEAIDVSTPHGMQMAEALAACGTV